MNTYLETLNKEQKEAVMHTEGPLLVVAGAGTGKTKTLTHRIFHLIKQGVDPRAILAITFTNKAAGEMRERVEELMKNHTEYRGEVPFVSTFHALGAFLLRNHAEKMGLKKHFTIADATDQRGLIKEAMKALDINPKQWEPRKIRSIISKNKGDLVDVESFGSAVNSQQTEITHAIWKRYEELLRDNSAIDFDDLLKKSYELLRDNPEILEYYQDRWKYIHIDEYQDTNTAQYRIAQLLAKKYKNICVVGDGDQNIYSWRGADMSNILNFEKDYPEARTIMLEVNYRSTQTILTAADDIITKNKMRVPKTLRTDNENGDAVKVYNAFSEHDEAQFITEQASRIISLGAEPSDIAVLFRTNAQSRTLEEAFLASGIPYQLLGVKFFQRKEVKDVLAYVRAALNRESLADIKRTITTPKRGIGPATIAKIFSGQADTLSPALQKKYATYQGVLDAIATSARTQQPSATIRLVLESSGLVDDINTSSEDDMERLANMQELVNYATRYDEMEPEEAIQKLMEDAALMGEQDSLTQKKDMNAVRLMTVHASKGLEFDYVFIAGLEQGLFPSQRDGDTSDKDAEEERRLMYVALTRARKELYLSHARVRRVYGEQEIKMPSEFLADISEGIVTHIKDPWRQDDGDSEAVVYLDF